MEETCWRPGIVDQGEVELLREAADALGDIDSVLRVRVLAGLARAHGWRGQWPPARAAWVEATAMARRTGDRQGLALALSRAFWTKGVEPTEAVLAVLAEARDLATPSATSRSAAKLPAGAPSCSGSSAGSPRRGRTSSGRAPPRNGSARGSTCTSVTHAGGAGAVRRPLRRGRGARRVCPRAQPPPRPRGQHPHRSGGADAIIDRDRSMDLQTGHVDQGARGVRLRYDPQYRILVAAGDDSGVTVWVRPLEGQPRLEDVRPETLPTPEQKPFGSVLETALLVPHGVAEVYVDNGQRPDGVAVIEMQRHDPGRTVTLRWVLYTRACG